MSHFKIDHIAVAVKNLPHAVRLFQEKLGFGVLDIKETRTDQGTMKSAYLRRGEVTFVLVSSQDSKSPISQFLDANGGAVHHVAIQVEGIENLVNELNDNGLEFSTELVGNPALLQRFSMRDGNTGIMFEFIQRANHDGFEDSNVEELLRGMEAAGVDASSLT